MKAVIKIGIRLLVILLSVNYMILGAKPANSQESPGPMPREVNMHKSDEESGKEADPAYNNLKVDEERSSENEDWIDNASYLNVIEMSVEAEPALKPEPWMSNDYYWSGKLSKSLKNMKVELEPELQIEDWMSDDEYWGLHEIEKSLPNN